MPPPTTARPSAPDPAAAGPATEPGPVAVASASSPSPVPGPPQTESPTVQDAFWAMVCADPDLLQTQFDAIITAGWGPAGPAPRTTWPTSVDGPRTAHVQAPRPLEPP